MNIYYHNAGGSCDQWYPQSVLDCWLSRGNSCHYSLDFIILPLWRQAAKIKRQCTSTTEIVILYVSKAEHFSGILEKKCKKWEYTHFSITVAMLMLKPTQQCNDCRSRFIFSSNETFCFAWATTSISCLVSRRSNRDSNKVTASWWVWGLNWRQQEKAQCNRRIDLVTPADTESHESEHPVLQIKWSRYSRGSLWPTATQRRLRTSTVVIKH